MITEAQLQQIDQFLGTAKLTDDYRLEFEDHIRCEIEDEMDNGLVFELAFELVKNKWVEFLRPRTTIFLGLTNSFPSIMIKRLTRASLKNMAYSVLLAAITIVPYFWYRKEIPESTNLIIRSVVLLVAVLSSGYFSYKFRFAKEKCFTSIYSNLIRMNSYGPIVFMLSSTVLFGFLSHIDHLNAVSLDTIFYSAFVITEDTSKVDATFLTFYLFLIATNFRLYYLHRQVANALTTAY